MWRQRRGKQEETCVRAGAATSRKRGQDQVRLKFYVSTHSALRLLHNLQRLFQQNLIRTIGTAYRRSAARNRALCADTWRTLCTQVNKRCEFRKTGPKQRLLISSTNVCEVTVHRGANNPGRSCLAQTYENWSGA